MSLLALRREYQLSINRIWKDLSFHSRAQTEAAQEAVEIDRHRSILGLTDQGDGLMQQKPQNAITSQVASGPEYIQHDFKAWGCLLDAKRRK